MIDDDAAFRNRAKRLQWLLFDVDGVLNDGKLIFSGEGEQLKTFHVRDGLGLKLAQKHGLKVGILSGRRSPALKRRVQDLELDDLTMNRSDKGTAFDEFLERANTTAERVGYAGDDLHDLAVLLRCGLSFAPADADPEVLSRVHRVLDVPGGHGVAREIVRQVLEARGEWARVLAKFLP